MSCRPTRALVSTMSLALLVLAGGSARADYVANKYTEAGTGQVLEYNVFVPTGYNPATKYPLMLVMHAAGTAADLPRTLSSDGKGWAATFISSPHQARDPSFFLIPISQTNASGWGDPITAISGTQKFEGRLAVVVLKSLLTRYNIDPDRLYVTGPSMGGRGTWDIIRRNPTLFAAAAPMAAPALAADAALYAGQNIWATNGENDSTVQANRDAVAAIRKAGGNPIYTELANHGHDTWRTVYPDAQFLDWVYAQRLGVPWTASSKAPVIAGLTGPAVIAPSGTGGAGGVSAVGGSSGAAGQGGGGGRNNGGGTGGQAGGMAEPPLGGNAGGSGASGGRASSGTGGGTTASSGGAAGMAVVISGSGGQPGAGSGGSTAVGTGNAPASGTGGAASGATGGSGVSVVGDGSVGCSQAPGAADPWSWVAALAPLTLAVLRRRWPRRRR